MQIKVYTIKLNSPRWLRNLIVYVALPVGALVGGAVVVSAQSAPGVALTTFTQNTPIKSAEVNANFANLKSTVGDLGTNLATLQTSAALLYGVAAEVATISNGSEVFSAAVCGPTGRVVTGLCVTHPVQPVGSASTGLWKSGAFDNLVNVAQTTNDPGLNSLWVCDVKGGNGITVQAYAICMKAP